LKTLVCRCEDVTLHELDDAMKRGFTDLESVKRYTGFGTGWCQGKSCLALAAQLIRERGGDASNPMTPRPPFHPVKLAVLAGLDELATKPSE
jgi:bacterioferritin-associated ferredoxin